MASVKVAVRIRPMNRREKDVEAKCIIEMEGKKTTITNLKMSDGVTGDSGRDRSKTFTYDFSYFSGDSKSANYVSQERVFKDLGTDVLTSAFEGYNACVFAYGQTGSGKSYTMMGNPGDSGLIPRICEGLFSRIAETTRWGDASFRTEVSYLEIYNERVRDLLRRKSSKTFNLRVREHPKEGPYVEDLSKHLVQNYSDVEELMDAGNINRTTAATGMNDVSSRSHAIFTINFTQAKFDAEMPCETVSKIHLVDLAGSERADASGATGVRLKEGGNINKSLVTLGNVISALADLSQDATNHLAKKKQVFVPYRDSVLTWLLKDSLGGNSKTIMIATISPADINYGETLSTLRYANRAKNIINKPTINEDCNVKLIRELRAEIVRLKALLAQGNQIALLDSPTALSMEEKLQQNEARVEALTKEWTNKWNETQNILKEQTLALRKEGIGVVLDSELPHLIGIDDDLLSTGIILYHLKEGRTYVGRDDAAADQDIVLHGLDLGSDHCIFENLNGTVTLIPLNGAQCSVNGIQILEPTQLNQGAVILLGRTNMFRFNHPKEAAKLREKRKSGLLSSFSLSMTDLSKSCENLSAVMLYNPGLEFERQQREELEKLENKRKLIKEMEEKQRFEKAELEKMQQEVESQRKESEIVQLHIRKQEESLKRRSLDIETRLKDLLAEKEKFEDERLREQQELELHKKEREEKCFVKVQEGLQRLQELHNTEKAEKSEIFKELEKLKKDKDEQYFKLELEKKRLEEQEREQLELVVRLEEQLREKQEMIPLLKRGDALRLEEEIRVLEDVREDLLRAKEARSEGDEDPQEVEKATHKYIQFKKTQLEQLSSLVSDLNRQRDGLEKEVIADRDILGRLSLSNEEQLDLHREGGDFAPVTTPLTEELDKLKQTEYRLRFKERQLQYIKQNHLPALLEEKQRANEIHDSDLLGLDKTLFQIEKEIEEKSEQVAQFRASSDQLQQLQETFEFTSNIARQEEKVRKKEKEIIESQEKQHREALEQAVAKLERRHSALQRHSTIDVEIEEQKRKLAALDNSRDQAGLQAGLEAEQKALEQDRERLSHVIEQLKQKMHVADPLSKNLSGSMEEKTSLASSSASPAKSPSHLLPLIDDRIHAYIEEEVQRRLQSINLPYEEDSNPSLSYSTETVKDCSPFLNGTTQRKLKYETCSIPKMETTSTWPWREARMAYIEKQRLKSATANSCSGFTKICFESQEKYLEEKNEKGSNRSSINEYFHFLSDTKCEPSHFLSTNLSNKKYTLQNVPCAPLEIPCQNKGKDSETAACDHDSLKDESDWTFLQQMTSSEMGIAGNEQPKFEDIFQSTLSETNILSEIDLKENSRSNPFHQGVLEHPHADQHTVERDFDRNKGSWPNDVSLKVMANHKYSFQYLFSKLTCLCKDSQLPTIENVVKQAKELCNVSDNARYTQVLSFIKKMPFLKHLQPIEPINGEECTEFQDHENKVKFYSVSQLDVLSVKAGQPTFCELSLRKETLDFGGHPIYKYKHEALESGDVFKQPFVQFPKEHLKLQNYLSEELLDYLMCALPELRVDKHDFKGAYWLCVANWLQPEPQPACLLLFNSIIYVIVSSNSALVLFLSLPLTTVQEVQICFGGQSIQLIGCAEESILAVFTYDTHYSQRICQDLVNILMMESDYVNCISHPLLKKDLMQLSLDWKTEVSDFVCTNGLKMTCRFRSILVDLVYLLHENMNDTKPPLGDVHLLLYTTVKVEHDSKHSLYRSLALTNTSIALLQEDCVFNSSPSFWSTNPSCLQFDKIQLHNLSDLRCIVLPDSEDLTKMTMVFSKKHRGLNIKHDSYMLQTISPPQFKVHDTHDTDVWKINLSSIKEALFLINFLYHC
ncbi:kinesin-like protein KIF16B isoform X3 [Ascaphus truei]|uniref:kinesin-like protein KIF16B isoform X3 n=1 Tax=Ascaphus truei TaxID=8439 RepID=UPI003F5A43D4